mmetsp:Transcript_73342/g.210610  ORF Transcript_73342/g.210610 Transcript_73342/m.210610 type:complete len:85 (+) Transcript_73342:49-303(+)
MMLAVPVLAIAMALALVMALAAGGASECAAHPKCKGVDGKCCPTKDGNMSECCNKTSCAAHPQCEGLEGDCCPTEETVKGKFAD